MMSVCTALPWVNGPTPWATPSALMWTMRSSPSSFFAQLSRKAIISRNFHVVSTCIRGNGGLAGWKAFMARWTITDESLPTE